MIGANLIMDHTGRVTAVCIIARTQEEAEVVARSLQRMSSRRSRPWLSKLLGRIGFDRFNSTRKGTGNGSTIGHESDLRIFSAQ